MRITKHLLLGLALAFLFTATAVAQPGNGRGGPPAGVVPGTDSIVDIVVGAASAEEDAEFTLLLGAVLYIAETNPDSALIAGLFNADQFTVFAPTDDAFLHLVGTLSTAFPGDFVIGEDGPFAAIDALLGEGTVEFVVSYHVTEGRRASNSVLPPRNSRTITTLADGLGFDVDPSGGITAIGNTATIAAADISASNGVIHVIDKVILPVEL